MVDWEVTATTIFCDDVDDEVTIIVNQNGTAKCTGSQKYSKASKERSKSLKRRASKWVSRSPAKTTPVLKLTKYRDELLSKK